MDILFGVAGRDYVILATDTMYRNNILVSKDDHRKCREISNRSAVVFGGNQGDCDRVVQGVLEELKYENIANELPLSEKVFSSALQLKIHGKLRQNPVEVTCIVGGITDGPGQLFMVDQYGACSSYKYMASGYGAPFFLTRMQMSHTEEMSMEETISLIKEVHEGVKKRLVLNYGNLHFCAITKEGIEEF